MRQLTVQVPRGYGQKVLTLMCDRDARNISLTSARSTDRPVEVVSALVENSRVGDVLDALETHMPQASVTLLPTAVLSLSLPTEGISQALTDTQACSPLEVFLQGVQSIGSWASYLVYALVAGVIVWIGLYTNSVFLLVASMLIAPFGGPAMNVAISSARGDFLLACCAILPG